jgi:YD repeat-containing protein
MSWFHHHIRTLSTLILIPVFWLLAGGPQLAAAIELQQEKITEVKRAFRDKPPEWSDRFMDQHRPEAVHVSPANSTVQAMPEPSPETEILKKFHPQFGTPSLPKSVSPKGRLNVNRGILNLLSGLFVSKAYAEPPQPLPDDLNETLDARFTQAIQDQAAALDNDPLKIYNWVRNNIQFVPTYGSIYGAELCLNRKTGNAFDTASLLIALYRESSIPAHYVHGKIQVPIDQARNWLGVDTPDAALAALVSGKIPATFVTDSGGTVTAIQMEHIWVSAYVDYIPSRAEVVHQGDQYVVMDPSFKKLDAGGAIVPENYPILLGTLPYTVLGSTQIYAALPDSLRPGIEPPKVNIISVNDIGSGQVEVRGSVSDVNLANYQLEYGLDGSDVFISMAAGTDPVDGVLGTLDSTVLENGIYTIKLSATDGFGYGASISTTYEFTGQLKIGKFSLAFNDLTIPVSGIPITITRTYNSFDKSKGSFGVGWSLRLSDIKLQEDINRNVILTLPDGLRARFSFALKPTGTFFLIAAKWSPESGVYDSLEMIGDNKIVYDSLHSKFLFFNQNSTIPFECFEIPGYILTLKDGTKFYIEKEILGYEYFPAPSCGKPYYGPIYGKAKLTKIEDLNGNTLTFTENGIIHSSGKSVQFELDGNGRITKITDPMGNLLTYEGGIHFVLVSV